jgi:peptide chain release factor 3
VAHFFERTAHGAYRAPEALHSVDSEPVRQRLPADVYEGVINDLEMLDSVGEPFDLGAVHSGNLSPVYFGSAINNFGIQILLDAIVDYAPPPQARFVAGNRIAPDHPVFSGFVFKIQSNMDPKHRDQIAFLRICSGRFTRDMKVTNTRNGESVRLSSSHRVFARDRETVDEAYAGDVIGLVGHSGFGIGDTLTEDPKIVYDEMPQFAPECFAQVYNPVPAQYKRFQAGVQHLLQEGALQAFQYLDPARNIPMLGAVGSLQFEVFKYRLENEYGAVVRMEPSTSTVIRWVDPEGPEVSEEMLPPGGKLMLDTSGRKVLLFDTEWVLKFFCDKHPKVVLRKLPAAIRRAG